MSNEEYIAYASVLRLNRNDIKTLKVHDDYALHKVVYGLFEDIRSEEEKKNGENSGILYADKGGNFRERIILILSNRKPHQTPQFGKVESIGIIQDFINHEKYAFEVTINPSKRENQSRKIIPLRNSLDIKKWFLEKAPKSWGFEAIEQSLEVSNLNVQSFEKSGHKVTNGMATIKGELKVTDSEKFHNSFLKGIGRGRSFGLGLLQIRPLI